MSEVQVEQPNATQKPSIIHAIESGQRHVVIEHREVRKEFTLHKCIYAVGYVISALAVFLVVWSKLYS